MTNWLSRLAAVGCIAWLGVLISYLAKHSKRKTRYLGKATSPEYTFHVCRDGWPSSYEELSPAQMDIFKTVIAKHVSRLGLPLGGFQKPVGHGVPEHELPGARNIAADQKPTNIQGDRSLRKALSLVIHTSADLNDQLQHRIVVKVVSHTSNETQDQRPLARARVAPG